MLEFLAVHVKFAERHRGCSLQSFLLVTLLAGEARRSILAELGAPRSSRYPAESSSLQRFRHSSIRADEITKMPAGSRLVTRAAPIAVLRLAVALDARPARRRPPARHSSRPLAAACG